MSRGSHRMEDSTDLRQARCTTTRSNWGNPQKQGNESREQAHRGSAPDSIHTSSRAGETAQLKAGRVALPTAGTRRGLVMFFLTYPGSGPMGVMNV